MAIHENYFNKEQAIKRMEEIMNTKNMCSLEMTLQKESPDTITTLKYTITEYIGGENDER